MTNPLSKLLEVRPWLVADGATGTNLFAMGLVLEGMHQHSMLARENASGQVTYGDMISRMMQDL